MKLSEMYDEINGVKWTGGRSLHKQNIKPQVAKLEDGLAATRIELGMAAAERAFVVMKYEQLEAKNDALQEYALALMTGPYVGMDREQRELILESELIALQAGEEND